MRAAENLGRFTHGNLTTVFWAKETNYYKRGGSGGTVTQYVRGGYPQHIEYSQGATFPTSEWAPAHVIFIADNRCVEALNGGACPWPAPGTEASWPDVPVDLVCGASSCANTSPSFFTWKRLTDIVTYTYADDVWHAGDHIKLHHVFPSPPDGSSDPKLYLSEIERTGEPATVMPPSTPHDGRASVTLPSVAFLGTWLANRADFKLELGVTPFKLPRVSLIAEELGGVLAVEYWQPHQCVDMDGPWDSNEQDCFPVWFKPDGQPAGWAVHNKWLVRHVLQAEATGGSPSIQVTAYQYESRPAWHHDLDPITPTDRQTWSDWRGHSTVWVTTGLNTSAPVLTEYRFFRGMHGDRNANGTTKTVNLVDSHGGVHADEDWLAGRVLETLSYEVLSVVGKRVLHDYWVRQTASRSTEYYGPRVARMVREERVQSFTTKGEGELETNVETTFNEYGQPTSVYDRGRVDLADDDRCTVVDYTHNTSAWILDKARRRVLHDGNCEAPIAGKTEYFYDGETVEEPSAPTRGDVTWSRRHTGTTWLNSYATYDAYGRVTGATSPRGFATTTAYAPPTSRLTESVTITNPAGHQTVTALEPVRLQQESVQDPNGRITRHWYDALGRLVGVQLPSESGSQRSYEFSYAVNKTDPPVVHTRRFQEPGVYLESWVYYDGFGRVREVQTPSPTGDGRTVVATRYDDRGFKSHESLPFHATGLAGSGLVNASAPPIEHQYSYDGFGRMIEDAMYAPTHLWSEYTEYDGDEYVTVTPSGRRTRYRVDLDGNVTAVFELTTSGESWAETNYEYNAAGLLTKITDDAGNVSTNTYDLAGRRVAMSDPDMGSWSYEYDANGNLTTTTSPVATVVSAYDVLDRPVWRRQGSSSGPLLAAWTYDYTDASVSYKGLLRSATSYADGDAYTKTIDQYSARGLPEHVEWTVPASAGAGLAGSWEFSTTYDGADHVVSRSYPAGGGMLAETVAADYDEFGVGTTLVGTNTYVSDTTLNGSSQLVGRVLGTGTHRVDRAYGYSASGRLRHLHAQAAPDVDPTEVQSDWYDYDDDGNIVRIQDDTNGSQRQCFAYDHRSRLDYAWTTADPGCGDWSDPDEHGEANYALDYSYDKIGNITALTSDGVTSSYSYGAGAAGPHAVTSVTSGGATTPYQYNGVGALAGFGPGGAGTTLGWDPQGRLVSHADAGGTTSFVYDADGNRILRREPDGAGAAVTLTLEGQEIRRDADGTIGGKRYYQLGDTVVAMRDGDGTAEGTVWWILGNHQGSIMTMVQRGTTTVTRQRYLPHGAPRGAATLPTDRGFLGKTEDDSTGLVHLGARYYDPRIARFISVDPLLGVVPSASGTRESVAPDQYEMGAVNPDVGRGRPSPRDDQFGDGRDLMNGSVHLQLLRDPYGYAADNPISNSDPTGLYCITGKNPNGSCRSITRGIASAADDAWDDTGGRVVSGAKDFYDDMVDIIKHPDGPRSRRQLQTLALGEAMRPRGTVSGRVCPAYGCVEASYDFDTGERDIRGGLGVAFEIGASYSPESNQRGPSDEAWVSLGPGSVSASREDLATGSKGPWKPGTSVGVSPRTFNWGFGLVHWF